MLTCVAGPALAFVVIDPLHAVLGAARVAGVGEALVDVSLAALPYKARGADAAVATYPIRALAIVKALGPQGDGIKERAAVIHIDLTVHPLSSSGAGAFVGIDEIDAGSSILAWVGQALIDLL